MPNTGEGSRNETAGYLLAIAVLAAAGVGMIGAVAYRRRQS